MPISTILCMVVCIILNWGATIWAAVRIQKSEKAKQRSGEVN